MTASAQDHAAALRTLTAQILLAANTIAGDRVDQERIDPIQPGDTPRLVVMIDQSGQTDSQAGGPPRFVITATLTVQVVAQRAVLADVLADLDTLTAQTKTALLCNPVWVTLASNIATMRVVSAFKPGAEYITGDARIQLTMTWFEQYNPDLTTYLRRVDMAAVIAPGETILSTITLGIS